MKTSEPGNAQAGELVEDAAQQARAEERAEDGLADEAGQSAEHGDDGQAEPDERRDQRHEDQVLDHVRAEQGVGDGLERRADGDPERGETAEKGEQARGVELVGRVLRRASQPRR